MKVDLTAAGLTEEARHILQVAANLLGAYRLSARLREWDGTRCDALFVDALDGYGRRAAESAQRRGIRVVHFGDQPATDSDSILHILPSSPISAIARHLQQLFVAQRSVPSLASHAPVLVRMATTPGWETSDLVLRGGGREVLILRSLSRVRAASLSDILNCRDHMDDPTWTLEVRESSAGQPASHHVAVSLDSFLCQAADASVAAFPAHGTGRWQLLEWPDLGAATTQVTALRLAQLLRRKPASVEELAAASGLPADMVGRCLWAFRAGGLLRDCSVGSGEPAPPAPSAGTVESQQSGMLARLARRFGLVWK